MCIDSFLVASSVDILSKSRFCPWPQQYVKLVCSAILRNACLCSWETAQFFLSSKFDRYSTRNLLKILVNQNFQIGPSLFTDEVFVACLRPHLQLLLRRRLAPSVSKFFSLSFRDMPDHQASVTVKYWYCVFKENGPLPSTAFWMSLRALRTESL